MEGFTVVVVQSVEHWIVVPGVVGSSPISHPLLEKQRGRKRFRCSGLFYSIGNIGEFRKISKKEPEPVVPCQA